MYEVNREGWALPFPYLLSLQGAGTDCKMPQGCGTREKGAATPHGVLAADTGGEEPLVGWLTGRQADYLCHMILFFPTVFPRGLSAREMGTKKR